jgi:hypothetical protein
MVINITLHKGYDSLKAEKTDIICQLNFLEKELKHHQLGDRMQRIFPEGFVFVNALYGLAWCELALADTSDNALKERAIQESLFAYDELNAETTRLVFPDDLHPRYGIFYNGWRNYLLSKILSVDSTFENSLQYVEQFKLQSEAISNALSISSSPYLDSYTYQSWPADMFVAMASLSRHDHLFDSTYKSQVDEWLVEVKKNVDPITKLIPHEVDSKTGMPVQGARGSSIGLILRLLGEIDQGFAMEQYKLVKDNFISTTVGLPSVREYPIGQDGRGDIDSGPVIWDVGFSATIVMIGALAICGEPDAARRQFNTINAFGFPFQHDEQKKYLSGKMPIADAFIAWGRATMMNSSYKSPDPQFRYFPVKFHTISAFLLLLFWLLFYGAYRLRYKRV